VTDPDTSLPAVQTLIPHRSASVLLDRALEYSGETAEFELEVRASTPYVRAGKLNAIVGVEIIAQAVAGLVGLKKRAQGRPVDVGYLVSVRDMQFSCEAFMVGDILNIRTSTEWLDGSSGTFSGAIRRLGEVLVTGQVTVVDRDTAGLPPFELSPT
jgi:predicted hotdog family 3-hydroxylacyl-ACP dehydratase